MEIKQKETGDEGSFYIEQDGKIVGEMVYSKANNILTIHHTEVGEELKGKGAGKQLVSKAVEWSRQNNFSISPRCLFARAVMERTEDFHDVLYKGN